jgi:replicative DNA helicase
MNNKESKEKINYNYEMQNLFVSMMITDFELFVRCQTILKPSYFDKTLSPVIKFILEYSEKYKGIPTPEIIKSEVNFNIATLETITDSQKHWFLDNIEKFCRHKAIESAILTSADMLEQGYYNDVEGLVKEAVLVSLNRELGTNYFEDPRARLEKLLNQNGNISTGWKSIDDVIYKLGRGELAIFTAITGGGKSVALQNLTVNWAMQNCNIVYFTLELSEELVSKRLDAMITEIPNASIFRQIDKVELIVKMKEKHLGSIQVKYVKPGTNTNDLRAYLKEYQIKNGKKPDMIIVDYLDLMYPNSKRVDVSNFFAKDKLVTEELRGLGMEENIIIATAAQLNRSGYDDLNPTAANIAGGISKAYAADLVVNVHNTPASRERGEITFMFIKTRNSGGVGKHIPMTFDVNTLRISDKDNFSENTSNNAISSSSATLDSPVFDNTTIGTNELYKSTINENKNDLSPALSRLVQKTKNKD